MTDSSCRTWIFRSAITAGRAVTTTVWSRAVIKVPVAMATTITQGGRLCCCSRFSIGAGGEERGGRGVGAPVMLPAYWGWDRSR